jgi:hypothetical protein
MSSIGEASILVVWGLLMVIKGVFNVKARSLGEARKALRGSEVARGRKVWTVVARPWRRTNCADMLGLRGIIKNSSKFEEALLSSSIVLDSAV